MASTPVIESNPGHFRTCAEELASGPLEGPAEGSARYLLLDLDICLEARCAPCTAACSYPVRPGNSGVTALRELAGYALVCRRCDHPHCVDACPHHALEQRPELGGMLVRHHLRCVGCRSCSHACPYGTIQPELVPYLAQNCDYCADRWEIQSNPVCVATCPHHALSIRQGDEDLPEDTFRVGRFLVHSTHWRRENA